MPEQDDVYTQDEDQRRERELEREDLQRVMWTEWGRRFVYRHLSRAGVYRLSYNGNVNDTVFNEGQRNMGLMLISELLEVCPNEYRKMLTENSGR